ncbi:hypothetical protein [Chloracidobacterium aggregatum]|jgi:hypothetical protein|uniref:hypothetical protein n=1 Tax=Chloracidobacterium aggregatum TaxID=2851959 RepID=UPI001B8D4ED1|nr:hypothetical protein [Chloracidobacterium aggregatum]QUV96069.1 hypothetical protein J8C00_06965 [Chloracidobacterium sp. E]QUV98967.1 hypothetical protein J8C02_05870 [Chloracidobacterium sp. MS 40/45]
MKRDNPYLQEATNRLSHILREVVWESPRVRSELHNLRAEGHEVTMIVEVSLAFHARQDGSRALAATANQTANQSER